MRAPPDESVRLRDGTTIHVRPVLPQDKPLFEVGMEHLSPASRFFRFLTPRQRLKEEELRYLTEIDGFDHHAIGAVHRAPGRADQPVAVARYIRLPERPEHAEAAITVLDAWQRRGVGTLMFRRLVKAALQRGIRVFRCDVHRENDGMRALLGREAPGAKTRAEGSLLVYEFPLFDP